MTKKEFQAYCPNQIFNIMNPTGQSDITIGFFKTKQDITNFPIEALGDMVSHLINHSILRPFIICNWYLPDNSPNRFIVCLYNVFNDYAIAVNSAFEYHCDARDILDDRAFKALMAYGGIEWYKKSGHVDKTRYTPPYCHNFCEN